MTPASTPSPAMTVAHPLARAALAGAASGGRTFTGLAALAVTAPPTSSDQPDVTLARPGVRAACCLVAAAELMADQLPNAPSRLAPAGLTGRLVVAAGCGVVLARRVVPAPIHVVPVGGDAAPAVTAGVGRTVLPVGVALAASAGGAVLGARWRAWAGRGRRRGVLAALAEDAVVIALAVVAARPPRPDRA